MNAQVLAGFLFIFISYVEARVELRLVHHKHYYEGRVEAFVNGLWGTISAKSWDKKAAQVICRQLGFNGRVIRYTKGLTYGHPKTPVPVWLRRINCNGTETELDACDHSGWKIEKPRLDFYDIAGVMCDAEDALNLLPELSDATRNVSRKALKVRLDGQKVNGIISAGILRISYDGKWGHVCRDGWDYRDMRVACGQLGFPDAVRVSRRSTRKRVAKVFLLNHVKCAGNEASLFSCDHDGLYRQVCRSERAVWLRCKVFKRTNKFKNTVGLKLRGGALPSEGRVELVHGHVWATLCDDYLNLRTASVVCRSLGYGTAYEANLAARFGQSTLLNIVDNLECTGFEKDISECKRTYYKTSKCSHFEDAGVKCNAPQYRAREVRLVGGRNASEGRVEVKVNGEWGTVCGDRWGIKDAMIVCRELGLNFAAVNITGPYFGKGKKMVMSGTICIGDELSLTQCLHDDVVECSSRDNVAAVRCTNALPDLALSIFELHRTLRVDYIHLARLQCAYEENCLSSAAEKQMNYPLHYKQLYRRRLMRFSTKILNYGSADYLPWAKKEDWIWHTCHEHFHSQEEFAVYDLLSPNRRAKIAEGHKASFCLEDTGCLSGVDGFYNCTAGTQGISVNCFDNYMFAIDCQWIDVTDVPHNQDYAVTVNINPRLQVAETDFDNNFIVCNITDKGSFVRVHRCAYDYCTSGIRSYGGNSFDACCVFPFKYKDKIYQTCTKAGFSRFWCSTTADYDKDKRWALC